LLFCDAESRPYPQYAESLGVNDFFDELAGFPALTPVKQA